VLRESGVEDIVLHNGASIDDDRDVLRLEGLSFTWIAA
jgi:hypothetical protein